MFSAIRNRITPATVIATVALILAMTGGAYAASKVLITSTKQISPKVLKALKGANGKNGANGSAGPQGSAGPTGPAGSAGPTGPAGAAGASGEKGEKGEKAAKGEKGEKGTEGSPWTAGGTLPIGSTETGTWSSGIIMESEITATENNVARSAPISFPIPLAAPLAGTQWHYVTKKEAPTAACPGSATTPEATSGTLCIYEGGVQPEGLEIGAESDLFKVVTVQPPDTSEVGAGVATSGAVALIHYEAGPNERTQLFGTWAVTG